MIAVRSVSVRLVVSPSDMPPCISERISWLVDVIAVHVTGPPSAARLTCAVFVPYISTLPGFTTRTPGRAGGLVGCDGVPDGFSGRFGSFSCAGGDAGGWTGRPCGPPPGCWDGCPPPCAPPPATPW